MKKTMKNVALMALVMVLGVMGFSATSAKAAENVTIPVLDTAAQLSTVQACYTQKGIVTSDNASNSDLTFTLAEDSWVYFTGNYALGTNDYGSTRVQVATDAAYTNVKSNFGWGYWNYDRELSDFYPAGTYYVNIKTTLGNGVEFDGNVNLIAGAVPFSKIFNVTVTPNKGKTSATVSFPSALDDKAEYVEYQPGNISSTYNSSSTYWKWQISGMWTGGNDACQVLEIKDNTYSFTAKKNGSYTILIQDKCGKRYSKVINVTGLDGTKPVVTGVKNKKTYKKSVKIKFSDKQSGIKSATLNGKKIKSGKKVSKKGSYTLVVKDKAGNTTKIKFKIKK